MKRKLKITILSSFIALILVNISSIAGLFGIDFPDVFSAKADAATFFDLGLITDEENKTASIDYCDSTASGVLIVPSQLMGYKIVSVSDEAFRGCENLTNIILPNGVTYIGKRAFSDCISLTSIIIPNSVTDIGEEAFAFCESLTSIIIPNSVTDIGEEAFSDCISLTSIIIPNSVTDIGEEAFFACANLKSVELGDNLVNIGDSCFAFCESLTSIIIPDSVTDIGEDAFYACANLKSVKLGDNLVNIGDSCFALCESLTSIIIPDSVTDIGEDAFAVTGLKNVTIGNGVTRIEECTFGGCESLTTVFLPNSIIYIDPDAFRESNIVNFLFSGTDEQWKIIEGSTRFYYWSGCSDTTIYYNVDEVIINDDLIMTFNKINDGKELSFNHFISSAIKDFTVPSTFNNLPVTNIFDGAFFECDSINSIIIPESIKSIGVLAFANCKNLISVTLGKNVESVKFGAFFGCIGLKDIYYFGTMKDFLNMAIEEWNEPLLNARLNLKLSNDVVISYGEKYILEFDVNVSENLKIVWTADNDNFKYSVSEDGKTCTIISDKSGITTFTAKVVDENGNIISEGFSQTMTSKAGFFQKLISFFKNLFKINRIIAQSIDSKKVLAK